MRVPDKEKQEILTFGAANIATIIGDYLPLKQAGHNLTSCCPFHGEKTPSFSVSPERGTWRCFGSCAEGGDVAKFIMKIDGLNFGEALQKIAALGGITIPGAGETKEEKERKAILSVLAKAEEFFRNTLAADTTGEGRNYVDTRMTPAMVETFGIGFVPKGGKALYHYLMKQGVSKEIAEKAGLIRKDDKEQYRDVFWGAKGRVMFPIKNKAGHTIGFAARTLVEEAVKFKYINSPETPVYMKYSSLYGLDKADLSSGEIFVVEGYLDHIQVWSSGTKNVVAACGTAFTKDHAIALKRQGIHRLNLMFDADNPGVKATQKAITVACKEELAVYVYSLPANQDPDSYFKSGGKIEDVTTMTGFEFLEQSGIELTGTMRELHRLERLERAMIYLAQSPAVAAVLKKRGKLEELFSRYALKQIQERLQLN